MKLTKQTVLKSALIVVLAVNVSMDHLGFMSGAFASETVRASGQPPAAASSAPAPTTTPPPHLGVRPISAPEIPDQKMPKFLDIAKNDDGSVKKMNHAAAIQYCLSKDSRLPSARELAQLSMSLGARGIVDSCDSDRKAGYNRSCYIVRATNADGSSDTFYFSKLGYQPPSGDLGENNFWSSSVYSRDADVAFNLRGGNGGVDIAGFSRDEVRRIEYAVRCVSP